MYNNILLSCLPGWRWFHLDQEQSAQQKRLPWAYSAILIETLLCSCDLAPGMLHLNDGAVADALAPHSWLTF